MKVALISMCVILLAAWSAMATTIEYGDVALSGGFQSANFPHVWDLTACDLTLSFTYDGNGLVDDFGGDAHGWTELGVRQVGFGNFNPTWMVEGAGVWLATDYDWSPGTFDPDPVGSPCLDIDDKLILQKGGGLGEGSYNLPSPPPNPWANHRVWFDRDGVDQWQALNPLAADGGTYNTGGIYGIEIRLHASGQNSGTAYMTINQLDQGFETDGNWKTMELSPAGMTWTGDMRQMQVFYGVYGYGATHNVTLSDVTVTGCPTTEVELDIKPGCWPDPFNVESKGVLPVAVFGSAEVDVNSIELTTLKLEGVAPLRWDIKDVTSDGFDDLSFKFDTQELVTAIGPDGQGRELNNGDIEILVLSAELMDGTPIWGLDDVTIINPKGGTSAAGASPVLKAFALYQNIPNPFKRRTTISFELRKPGFARLDIHDASGRLVRTLVEDELSVGTWSYEWDASHAASGVYFYRLSSGGHSLTGKMLMVK